MISYVPRPLVPPRGLAQIKELATKYSEFISFPIEVWAEKTTYDQIPDPDAEVKEGEQPKMKTVTRTAMQWEVRHVLPWHRPRHSRVRVPGAGEASGE